MNSLNTRDEAQRIRAMALDRGRLVVVWIGVRDGQRGFRKALSGSARFNRVVASGRYVGVYDGDCLVRHVDDDLRFALDSGS